MEKFHKSKKMPKNNIRTNGIVRKKSSDKRQIVINSKERTI